MELDALAEPEGVGEAVLGNLITFGELRNGLQILVERVEAFVEGARNRTRQVVDRIPGIERRESRRNSSGYLTRFGRSRSDEHGGGKSGKTERGFEREFLHFAPCKEK